MLRYSIAPHSFMKLESLQYVLSFFQRYEGSFGFHFSLVGDKVAPLENQVGELKKIHTLWSQSTDANEIDALRLQCLHVFKEIAKNAGILVAASAEGHADGTNTRILNLLIDAGADINALNSKGTSALHEAAYWGRTKHVQLLLEHGADVELRDEKGNTPYIYAAQSSYSGSAVMETLRAHDADILAKNSSNETALSWYCSRNFYSEIDAERERQQNIIKVQGTLSPLLYDGLRERDLHGASGELRDNIEKRMLEEFPEANTSVYVSRSHSEELQTFRRLSDITLEETFAYEAKQDFNEGVIAPTQEDCERPTRNFKL